MPNDKSVNTAARPGVKLKFGEIRPNSQYQAKGKQLGVQTKVEPVGRAVQSEPEQFGIQEVYSRAHHQSEEQERVLAHQEEAAHFEYCVLRVPRYKHAK